MIEPERLDYPLTADSLVWDVGAFKGEFAAAILHRYACSIFAFEPVQEFATEIIHAIGDRVNVFSFGLADREFETQIHLAGDRTSAHTEAALDPLYHAAGSATAWFKDVVAFIDQNSIDQIDLAKINIEGGEYPLLRRLIDSGHIARFRFLQVQFHTFIPEFGEKYLAIKKDLERTHTLSWRRPWIWESWARR